MSPRPVFLYPLLLVALASLPACSETSAPLQPADPPGFGTPVVDGVVSTDEWANAQAIPVFENTPALAGSVLYVLNDAMNMYFGLRTPLAEVETPSWLEVRFDDDRDGSLTAGDDLIGVDAAHGFYDGHMGSAGQYVGELQEDGTGVMRIGTGGVHLELAHPLTGDPDDISVAPGQAISICLRYYLPDFTSGSKPDMCFIKSFTSFFDITLANPAS